MKKIMFNDKYGLTQAVLEGRKTMTRRAISEDVWQRADVYRHKYYEDTLGLLPAKKALIEFSPFKPGEVVAVAQSYNDSGWNPNTLQQTFVKEPTVFPDLDPISPLSGWIDLPLKYHKGWSNKMFVYAGLMPHQIRITNIRVEMLQDISEEDCYREGIYKKTLCPPGDIDYFYHSEPRSKWEVYPSAREAFAGLIDKVSGKGTWQANPYCFCYTFELIR